MKEQNKVMSAEGWYYNQLSKQSGKILTNFEIATQYANYILSKRIDELAERIAENAEIDHFTYEPHSVIDKSSILKIANYFKTELNLQSSK